MDAPFKNDEKAVRENLKELKEIKGAGLSKSTENILIRKKLSDLAVGKWGIVESILIDIEVAGNTNVVLERQKVPYSCPELLQLATLEVQRRFKDEPDLAQIITEALPNLKTLQKWVKKGDWKEEVEKRIKDDQLFSLEKRAKVINMVYNKAMNQDLKAAETYLKLSGDLSNQPQQKDKGYEAYQDLVTSLVKKG